MESFRWVGAMVAAVIVASLIGASSASAVPSKDTLASPDCNSTAHEETTEVHEDGSSNPHEDDDWGVSRIIDLEVTGERNSRVLELTFRGWHDEFGENGIPQPAVARNHYYDQGSDRTRTTTVAGESSASVRLHLGSKRIIELGTFQPIWDGPGTNAGGMFGAGTGAWGLQIPLRKHLKALRKHEFKAKGSRTRVSLDYVFPATKFVRQERSSGWVYPSGWVDYTATQTKTWSAADCELRSRRLRLSVR